MKSDEARTSAGRGVDGGRDGERGLAAGGGRGGGGGGGGAESNVEMQARAHLEVVQSYIQGAQDRHL